jgi:hypothetical protein
MESIDRLHLKRLKTVLLGHNHAKVHPAWVDESNEGFLICYEAQLVFDDGTIYVIRPCEENLEGRYPALGLSLEQGDSITLENVFPVAESPVIVTEVLSTDHLGEEVINQWLFRLENNMHLIIRHVYPPMSLGIKVAVSNA